MTANRENFKAQALELLGDTQARLTTKERHELFAIAFSRQQINAAQAATVNRISERVRGVVA